MPAATTLLVKFEPVVLEALFPPKTPNPYKMAKVKPISPKIAAAIHQQELQQVSFKGGSETGPNFLVGIVP